MIRFLAVVAALLCASTPGLTDNWPGWRGPTGQGVSPERHLPLRWGPTKNVCWKVPLPDAGNSTPVAWGERIFVTQASDKTTWPPRGESHFATARRRSLLCFRSADGTLLWQRDVFFQETEATHPTNPFCSASPATDGERVVVSFGSAGMHCFNFEGKELWHKDLGRLEHIWGNASSPILFEDLAILWCGPGKRQFLLGVNKQTGQEVWQHTEPGGASGIGTDKSWVGSWSTPIVVRVGGQDQLILNVPEKVKGFDPRTGKELWSCAGLGPLVYTSPLYANGIVVAMSGFHGPALAVRLGGRGDITKDRLWHHVRGIPQRIGSGVIVGEHIYIVEENGVPHCFELVTGREVWDAQGARRLGASCWSSMVSAGERLYVVDQGGTTHVLAARPRYEHIAAHQLGEHTNASIAVLGRQLILRTYKHLWCIAGRE